MSKGQRILALDIGASTIKLAEFTSRRAGSVELNRFGVGTLGLDSMADGDRSAVITATIKELIREFKIKPGAVLLSVSGQSVFSRFVKLPPVDRSKVYQIIAYEAQQNVPFPIDEVVWDYQLIGRGEGELDVMLAAIKADIIVEITNAVEAAGLRTDLVDVAPMALYNAVRFNYSDAAGCTLVVDIGARSTDLIFLEQGKVFIRSVPVAGNAITQQVMREFELSHEDAEELKRAHAFVAFGGAHDEPESEVAAKVSKIVRNVMTRMHAEIDRSIKFYRSQQGGMQPSLVLLTGGSSVVPYLDRFLNEKLKVDVAELNPFVNVPVSESVSADYIGKHAHELAQVVGLALRRAMTCPIEVNLLPPHVVAEKEFRRRHPLLVTAAISLALMVGLWAVFFARMGVRAEEQMRKVQKRVAALEAVESPLHNVEIEIAALEDNVNVLRGVNDRRVRWLRILSEIQEAMPPELWIVQLRPVRGAEGNDRNAAPGSVRELTLRGMGYADKVPSPDLIKAFRDNLRASELFSDETEFISLPTPAPGQYTREFTISVVMESPIAP